MREFRYAPVTGVSFMTSAIKSYAKSFRIKGVIRLVILSGAPADSDRHQTIMVQMSSSFTDPKKIMAVQELLEYLLHCRVTLIPVGIVDHHTQKNATVIEFCE